MTCVDPRCASALMIASDMVQEMRRLIPAGAMSPELAEKVAAASVNFTWFAREAGRQNMERWLAHERLVASLATKGGEPC
ncbi:MAG: hypothetical protein ABF856_05185 [Acetobacter aceti]